MRLTQLFGEPQKTAHISKQSSSWKKKALVCKRIAGSLAAPKPTTKAMLKPQGERYIPGQFGGEGTSSNHRGSVVFMACKRKQDSSFICYGVISHLTNVTMGRSNSFKPPHERWWILYQSRHLHLRAKKKGSIIFQKNRVKSNRPRIPDFKPLPNH